MPNFNLLEYMEQSKLLESLKNIFNTPFGIITTFLDLIIVVFLIYKTFKILKETRAWQLIKGILTLLIITLISEFVNFKILNYILTSLMSYGVIMLIIVFQPELRRALEQLGGTNRFSRFFGFDKDIIARTKEDISKVKEMLETKENMPGYTAPACGLYLEKIEY